VHKTTQLPEALDIVQRIAAVYAIEARLIATAARRPAGWPYCPVSSMASWRSCVDEYRSESGIRPAVDRGRWPRRVALPSAVLIVASTSMSSVRFTSLRPSVDGIRLRSPRQHLAAQRAHIGDCGLPTRTLIWLSPAENTGRPPNQVSTKSANDIAPDARHPCVTHAKMC
jgi:hypothetical protein